MGILAFWHPGRWFPTDTKVKSWPNRFFASVDGKKKKKILPPSLNIYVLRYVFEKASKVNEFFLLPNSSSKFLKAAYHKLHIIMIETSSENLTKQNNLNAIHSFISFFIQQSPTQYGIIHTHSSCTGFFWLVLHDLGTCLKNEKWVSWAKI